MRNFLCILISINIVVKRYKDICIYFKMSACVLSRNLSYQLLQLYASKYSVKLVILNYASNKNSGFYYSTYSSYLSFGFSWTCDKNIA